MVDYFIEYANKKCKIFRGKEVGLKNMETVLNKIEEGHYNNDEDAIMVFHEEFTHNRLVKVDRLFDETRKDFSLMEKSRRSIILLNRQ